MKIITVIPFTFILVISNSTFSASKEKWVWEPFVSNETGTYYYHKEHSPKTEDGLFLSGVTVIYRQPQSLMNKNSTLVSYQSKYQTVMFDCNQKTVSTPDTIYYASSTGSGQSVGFESIAPPEVKWIAVESEPIYRRLLEKFDGVCN